MKTRNGFVSNSSSTSFIVQKKNVEDTYISNYVKITIDVDLIDLTDKIIRTKEDLDSYFKDRYWTSEDYKNDKQYIKMKKLLKPNKPIYILTTSNDETGLRNSLYSQREALEEAINESENFTLIDGQQE